ncbi:7860_t:CDS:2, partial [Racocetra persica]
KEQEDPRIRTELRQLKQRLDSIETNYKYISQLTRQQTDKYIQEIERVTNRKIFEAETAEDKKAYLYKMISALTETKDAILWKNKDLVKNLEEEYGYATNQALNLNRKDFEAMQEELLGVSLENLDKIHNVEDEEEQIFQEQQRARRQGLELPETLLPKHPYHKEYLPTINELREPEQIADRWLLDENFGLILE